MDKVIGLITANYETKELGILTEERTVASLPFGGRYRLVDFPLSNMVNSGIRTVGLITPYKYRSIIDHVGAGKEWGLARKNGGLFILPGSVFGISSPNYRFLLRDLRRNLVYLMRSPAPYVLVTAANTVYNMDYSVLVDTHIRSGADMTLLYTQADREYPHTMGLNIENDKLVSFSPKTKKGGNRFLDCFITSRDLLLKILEWYGAVDYLDVFEALEADFEKMDIRALRFDGYSSNICSVQDYYQRSMELLKPEVYDQLFMDERPILTKILDIAPTKYSGEAKTMNTLMASGCVIEGTVENSILFQNVKIGKNAVVKNSILMENCEIEDGACVENTILDRNDIVHAGMVIKGSSTVPFVQEKNFI